MFFNSQYGSTARQVFGLLGWLLLSFLAAAAGVLASVDVPEFYASLNQPSWAPPAWLFGPAWTVLYILIAIAGWLVWRPRGFAGAPFALSLFIVQMVFNALWTWLFFVWHLGAWSFAEILFLWVLIASTIAVFWTHSRSAALLLVPYLMWVTFASALNYAMWTLNPEKLAGF